MMNVGKLNNNVDAVMVSNDENRNVAVPFTETNVENAVIVGDAAVAYGKDAIYPNAFAGPSSEVDVRSLSRPTLYGNYTWSAGGGFSQQIKPWQLLDTNTLLAAYMATVAHFSMDAVVRVVINGDPTTFGRLCLYYGTIFKPTLDPTLDATCTAARLVNSPHIMIDPSTPVVHELVIPMLSRSGIGTLDTDVADIYNSFDANASTPDVSVWLVDFAGGLRSSGAAVAPAISVSVFVYFKNVRLFGAVTRLSLPLFAPGTDFSNTFGLSGTPLLAGVPPSVLPVEAASNTKVHPDTTGSGPDEGPIVVAGISLALIGALSRISPTWAVVFAAEYFVTELGVSFFDALINGNPDLLAPEITGRELFIYLEGGFRTAGTGMAYVPASWAYSLLEYNEKYARNNSYADKWTWDPTREFVLVVRTTVARSMTLDDTWDPTMAILQYPVDVEVYHIPGAPTEKPDGVVIDISPVSTAPVLAHGVVKKRGDQMYVGPVTFTSKVTKPPGKVGNDGTSSVSPWEGLGNFVKRKLAPFMTSTTIDKTLGYAGYMLGFARRIVPTNTYGMNTNAEIANVMIEVPSYHPDHQQPVSGTTYGDPDPDPLALASITQRYGFLDLNSLTTSAETGTQLIVLPVTPVVLYMEVATGYSCPSPLAHTAIMYEYWRGSLTYRLTAISNAFCRGVIAIRHCTAPDDYDDLSVTTQFASTDPVIYMDLKDNSCIEFTIPWKQSCAMADVSVWVPSFNNSVANRPAAFRSKSSINGVIYIEVVTPLHCPYTPNEVEFLLEIKAGPDFILSGPTMAKISNTGLFIGDITPTSLNLGPENNPVNPTLYTTGATEVSLRPLLKIPQTFALYERNNLAKQATGCFYLPIRQPRQATEIDQTYVTALNTYKTFQTFRTWISAMFLFEKGGTVYTICNYMRGLSAGASVGALPRELISVTRVPVDWVCGSDGTSVVDPQALEQPIGYSVANEFNYFHTPGTALLPGPVGNAATITTNATTALASFVLTDNSPTLMRTVAKFSAVSQYNGDAQFALVTYQQPSNGTAAVFTASLLIGSCGADDYALYHYYSPPVWQVRGATFRAFWGITP